MKKEDLYKIIIMLNNKCYDEFETYLTAILFECSEREYEAEVRKVDGKLIKLEIRYIKDIPSLEV